MAKRGSRKGLGREREPKNLTDKDNDIARLDLDSPEEYLKRLDLRLSRLYETARAHLADAKCDIELSDDWRSELARHWENVTLASALDPESADLTRARQILDCLWQYLKQTTADRHSFRLRYKNEEEMCAAYVLIGTELGESVVASRAYQQGFVPNAISLLTMRSTKNMKPHVRDGIIIYALEWAAGKGRPRALQHSANMIPALWD